MSMSGGRSRDHEQPYQRVLNDGVELVDDVLDGLGCLFIGLLVVIALAGVTGGIFAALPAVLGWLLVAGALLTAAWCFWRR